MADPIKYKLTSSIQAHGATLTELELRKPTVMELRACGMPYKMTGAAVQADYAACAKLLSAICAIPPSSVDQMDAADFDDAALILVGFLKRAPVEGTGTGSGSTS